MADGFDESLSSGGDLDMLAINTLRTLAIDAVEKANSGIRACPGGGPHGPRALDPTPQVRRGRP